MDCVGTCTCRYHGWRYTINIFHYIYCKHPISETICTRIQIYTLSHNFFNSMKFILQSHINRQINVNVDVSSNTHFRLTKLKFIFTMTCETLHYSTFLYFYWILLHYYCIFLDLYLISGHFYYMFRFYSIFFNLYSISVYFYCISFVYIVYSSFALYIFGFVFNNWPFLFDFTSFLLYISGFVLYNNYLYSIYFDICI